MLQALVSAKHTRWQASSCTFLAALQCNQEMTFLGLSVYSSVVEPLLTINKSLPSMPSIPKRKKDEEKEYVVGRENNISNSVPRPLQVTGKQFCTFSTSIQRWCLGICSNCSDGRCWSLIANGLIHHVLL